MLDDVEPEDDDEDEAWFDEDELDGPLNAPLPDLGWRLRPALLALLEAAALSRRSSSCDVTGALEPLEIQALGALAALSLDAGHSEQETELDGLAALLSSAPSKLQEALAALATRGLVQAGMADPVDDEDSTPWSITPDGITAVETWVARCLPLLAGWPPDHDGVDDAVG